jgi:two-component system phosphate regulon sensor histidine kinase PhoR
MSILSDFLREVDEGYAVINTSGIVVYANDFMIKRHIIKENWEGKLYYECFNLLAFVSAIAECIAEKKRIKIFVEHDQMEYSVDLFSAKDGILLRITDITQFKRYERSKKEFLANVSHELKTPIAIIRSILETLIEEEQDEKKKSMLERALRRSEDMKNLVEDLLIITKLESGEEKLRKENLSLWDVVELVFDNIKEVAQNKKVQLINRVDENFKIYADQEKLALLLLNLVDNAVKYNKTNGEVVVSAYTQDAHAVIEVSDTGIGIPKEHLPFVFERFYRVDRSRSKEVGGTGLGLSIVKHIALSHGGKVEVESKEGEGSKFRVYLPVNYSTL